MPEPVGACPTSGKGATELAEVPHLVREAGWGHKVAEGAGRDKIANLAYP